MSETTMYVRHDTIGRLKQKIKGLEQEVALLKQPSKEGQMMLKLRALLREIVVEDAE